MKDRNCSFSKQNKMVNNVFKVLKKYNLINIIIKLVF